MKPKNRLKGNILIVDDTPANLRLLANLLTQNGYSVRPAPNGQLALSGAQAIPPDLILLDIKMPGMDGYAVCEQLQQHEKTREIPVIFLSALDDIHDKVKAFSSGGVDYITKPFQAEEVLARLETHLELKWSREKIQESYQIIKQQQEQAMEELEEAKNTQLALFPRKLPKLPNTRMVRKYLPTNKIGGDFYEIQKLTEQKYGIMIGDATGHGISAALISFMVSGIFKEAIKAEDSPQQVLSSTNQALNGKIPEAKFATLFYATYEPLQRLLTYAKAGHPPGLVIRKSPPSVLELNARGAVIGLFTNQENPLTEEQITLLPEDKLLLYTDGLIEIKNPEEKMWGVEGLSSFLKDHCQLSIEDLMEQLIDFALSYSNQDQFEDDCTLIGLEVES